MLTSTQQNTSRQSAGPSRKSAVFTPAGTPKAKKASKPKVAAAHPPYASMIKAAITNLKEPKGASKQAILKYILANYKVGTNPTAVNSRLRIALRRAEQVGAVKHAKPGAVGASGRFKLGDKKEKKPKAKKPKAVKKPKKTTTSPKKAASKPKKAKSPKKAKKAPAAKKASPTKKAAKPKKKASPKKKVAKK